MGSSFSQLFNCNYATLGRTTNHNGQACKCVPQPFAPPILDCRPLPQLPVGRGPFRPLPPKALLGPRPVSPSGLPLPRGMPPLDPRILDLIDYQYDYDYRREQEDRKRKQVGALLLLSQFGGLQQSGPSSGGGSPVVTLPSPLPGVLPPVVIGNGGGSHGGGESGGSHGGSSGGNQGDGSSHHDNGFGNSFSDPGKGKGVPGAKGGKRR